MFPLRNASAIARGTSASAITSTGSVLRDLGLHLLFGGHGFGASAFRLGACHARVGLGLVRLQAGTDVLADVDVGDVDRHDRERRVGIEAARQHGPRDPIGILQHFQVRVRRNRWT